jgi:DnaK suppressor protein
MDNDIDPAIGRWYQRVRDGRLFQVVAVDDDEELVEWQDFDGGIGEVSLDEFHSWDIEVTAAPEDWTGPLDEIQRGDLDYSEIRSEGEERGIDAGRRSEAIQSGDFPDTVGGESVGRAGDRGRNRSALAEYSASVDDGQRSRRGGPETDSELPPSRGRIRRRRERQARPADDGRQSGRADGLDRDGINEVKARLSERAEYLRQDIQRELRKYDDESYTRLAERIADSAEQAWSDLVSDLNLAEITRDVHEIRDIDTALQRLAQGQYGICIDCGDRIEPKRLDANPSAVRCLECQRETEHRKRQTGQADYPSL